MYILILIVLTTKGTGVATAEYATKRHCEHALSQVMETPRTAVKGYCTVKGGK